MLIIFDNIMDVLLATLGSLIGWVLGLISTFIIFHYKESRKRREELQKVKNDSLLNLDQVIDSMSYYHLNYLTAKYMSIYYNYIHKSILVNGRKIDMDSNLELSQKEHEKSISYSDIVHKLKVELRKPIRTLFIYDLVKRQDLVKYQIGKFEKLQKRYFENPINTRYLKLFERKEQIDKIYALARKRSDKIDKELVEFQNLIRELAEEHG